MLVNSEAITEQKSKKGHRHSSLLMAYDALLLLAVAAFMLVLYPSEAQKLLRLHKQRCSLVKSRAHKGRQQDCLRTAKLPRILGVTDGELRLPHQLFINFSWSGHAMTMPQLGST